MFYCEKCADKNGWPKDWFSPMSRGACECCSTAALCYDVPSRALPMPKQLDPIPAPKQLYERDPDGTYYPVDGNL